MEMPAPVTRRATSIERRLFERVVSMFCVSFVGAFISGCTRIETPNLANENLTYHQEGELTVVVAKGMFSGPDLDAMLEDTGTLAVVGKSHSLVDAGRMQLTFRVVPIRAGNALDVAVRYGKGRSSLKHFKVDVAMAAFSGRSNASFLEMMEAPDTSIYGSHITMWSGAGTQYVSGHAASNICRKISAAVIDFAISHAVINDDFFVGAGFASLPEDRGAAKRLAKQLLGLPHPKSLDETLENIADSDDSSTANDFADVLNDPQSYKPRPQGAEHFSEVLEREEVDSNTSAIVGWINNPEEAVALMAGGSEFGGLIEDVKAMPESQRVSLAHALRQYGALLNSEDLLNREVDDVAERSGLVRKRERIAPEPNELAPALSDWGKRSASGAQAALSALARAAREGPSTDNDDSFDFREELRKAALAAGIVQPQGIVLMPFLNATTGNDVVFTLPKTLLFPKQSAGEEVSILETLRKSVTREMIANLQETAKRQEDQYRKVVAQDLTEVREEMATAPNPTKWLHEKRTVVYQLVDDRGRPTGKTEERRVSNFELWVDRLDFAEISRRLALLYAQSARRIQENENDPKAASINDSALLDSFLRGWDLAFVDNSNESPYRTWVAARRTAVWGAIFEQAAPLGIDPAPLVTEQTVFQVRAEGDHYRVRPMFVGDISDTTVAKSDDGRLLYYRSPWMQRQVVYLSARDVQNDAWTNANAQFKPKHTDRALAILAGDVLNSALAEPDRERRRSGIRRALAIDAKYTADRLIEDYWAQWRESPAAVAEEALFERIIAEGDLTVSTVESALGVSQRDVKADRFRDYMRTRAFEGGLRVMRCLAGQAGSIENDTIAVTQDGGSKSKEAEVADRADKCFSKPAQAEMTALGFFKLDKLMAEIQKTIAESTSTWTFDALGRSVAVSELQEGIGRLATPLLQSSTESIKAHPTKRAYRSFIRLQWYSGDFLAALKTTLASVERQAPSVATDERAGMLADIQMDLLKGLVYSGLELGTASEPPLSVASISVPVGAARRENALFGLRNSDFAMQPESMARIAYRVVLPEGPTLSGSVHQAAAVPVSRSLPQFVSLSSEQSADAIRALSDANGVGSGVVRTADGLRTAVWIRDGQRVREATFTDVLDDAGKSQVTRLVTIEPTDGEKCVELLRKAGFELLQGKKLPEALNRPVLLTYPDQVVLLSGNDVLRFSPPSDTKEVAAAVRTAFEQGNVHLASLSSEGGLLQEARYIVSSQVDPSAYFSSAEPFPGVVAFARDGEHLRMLVRDAEGGVSLASLENNQLRKTATGAQALDDLQNFERVSLAARSDDKVKFIHLSVFDSTPDATIRMQVGRVSHDVPVSEIRGLLEHKGQSTPVLDELFSVPKSGDRPTFVLYRDALVRGGGDGRQPPGTTYHAVMDGEPPDPDLEFMVGMFKTKRDHMPAVPMLLALTEKYPGIRFVLDDMLDVARKNAIEPVLVSGVKDLAAYLPVKSFRVTTLGTITNIRQSLESSGVRVESSMAALAEQNVLVISGHKDRALEAYIDAHIKAGNLKGKQVVLFSCYQAGDANLAHRIVKEGGAKGVVFFSEEIRPEAVNEVVKQLALELKSTRDNSPTHKQLIDVLDQSIESTLKNKAVPPEVKKEVEILRGRVPQISAVQAHDARHAA
jgi:hypothetical protein